MRMDVHSKQLGLTDYMATFAMMKDFTLNRQAETPDELWLTQHHPVFTQGQAGKPEHILTHTDIPIVQSDRGGQVTYHAPGQLILYFLVDIKRRGMGVRAMVSFIEQLTIDVLATYAIVAFARPDAPGVYVEVEGEVKKIASLGLRVRNGRTYHGVSLNVAMDLTPFSRINPCGYSGLQMTQVSDLLPDYSLSAIAQCLLTLAEQRLTNTPGSAQGLVPSKA